MSHILSTNRSRTYRRRKNNEKKLMTGYRHVYREHNTMKGCENKKKRKNIHEHVMLKICSGDTWLFFVLLFRRTQGNIEFMKGI